jgi:hypothetical protein
MPDRFTVYDVFAVLIPGILIGTLFALTAHNVTGWRLPTWTTDLGDAGKVLAVLVVGYAFGELLQALGKAVTTGLRRLVHKGPHASFDSLLEGSKFWSEEFRGEVLIALQDRYGQLPRTTDPTYRRRLHEVTDRAFKLVETKDASVGRQLAEQHQMRAYFVGFGLLTSYTLSVLARRPVAGHGATLILVGATCGALAGLAGWRMFEKDRTVATYIWTHFLELMHDERIAQLPAQGEMVRIEGALALG